MLRRQFGKANAIEMWADVLLDRGLIAGEGSRTDACPRHVLQPARQELRHCLTLVRHQRAFLRGPQRVLERICDGTASPAVDCFAPALPVLPPEIDARHPSAISAL